jgi:hypothetical protein
MLRVVARHGTQNDQVTSNMSGDTESVALKGLQKLEMRSHFGRPWHAPLLALLFAGLILFQRYYIVPAMAALGSTDFKPLFILLDPPLWLAVYISRETILKQYRTLRARDIALTPLDSKFVFRSMFRPLFLLLFSTAFTGALISLCVTAYRYAHETSTGTGDLLVFGGIEALANTLLLAVGAPLATWAIMIILPRFSRALLAIPVAALLLSALDFVTFLFATRTWIMMTRHLGLANDDSQTSWIATHRDFLIVRAASAVLVALVFVPLAYILLRRFNRLWDE